MKSLQILAGLRPVLLFSASIVVAVGAHGEQSPRDLVNQANAAYQAQAFEQCSALYDKALEAGLESANGAYNGACCAALADNPDRAFEWLKLAAERGYKNPRHLVADTDLESLHGDPRWQKIVSSVKTAEETFLSSIHNELYELYKADQGDRSGSRQGSDWANISKRDAQRRQRVLELLALDAPKVGADFFHAAMVLQHGNAPEHFKKAHELAKKATELDPELSSAKWLSAAAWDRYLWNIDQPQIYGTQYSRPNAESPWTMEPFDRDAVTDDERRELNVPPLAEALKRLERMNARPEPQPSAEQADGEKNDG